MGHEGGIKVETHTDMERMAVQPQGSGQFQERESEM